MSNISNINSLTALRERREELADEQKKAQKGLTSTLAQAPAKAKDYALEDLALPALGIGLAVYVGYRLLRPRKSSGHAEVEAPVYREVPAGTTYSAPTSRPKEQPRRKHVAPAKKSLFNFSTLMNAGKILIPATQAIIGVVQNQQTKQDIQEATE